MDFAANFTAIDFETASRRPDSACQLGAVVVRDGRIVDEAMWMIRPRPLYFSRSNIQIHGITPERVRSEPLFGDLWPEIAEKLGQDCLVAHNASFDIGVLLASLSSHQQTVPELHFTCTRAIARRTWPHHRRFGLKPLSDWLGVRFDHHDALEDSIACAKILLAAGIDRDAASLEDLEKQLKLSRGKAGPWGQRGVSGRSSRRRQSTRPAPASRSPFLFPNQVASPTAAYNDSQPEVDLQRLMIRAEFIRPLSGQCIVFSGRLRNLTREQAETLAKRLGGTCQNGLSESTDVLVAGEKNEDVAQAEVQGIRIVNEAEFLALVITPTST